MNQAIKHIILACFLFANYFSFAQRYNFTTYSVNEGLPRAGVYEIHEDKYGFIWVATEGGGVSVFDGHSFKTYDITNGLASDVVRCIGSDDDGRLWFGTQDNGVSIFSNNHFINLSEKDGLPHNTVRSVVPGPDSTMWLGTFNGVAIYHPDSQNKFMHVGVDEGLPHPKVRVLLNDKKGTMWIGSDGGLVQYRDGKIDKVYTTEDGLPHDRVLCLFIDNRGALWGGTPEGAFKLHNDRIEVYTTLHGLIHNRVRSIVQDKNGHYWFGTKEGVSKFNGITFTHYSEKQGLSNNRIRYMITDRSDNIWFGTYYGGICKFSGEVFTYLDEREGLKSNQVTALEFFSDDHLAIGTNEGLQLLELRGNELSYTQDIHFSKGITCLKMHRGRMLIGTESGIFNWTHAHHKTVHSRILFNESNISSISPQSDTVIWVGSDDGVYRLTLSEDGNQVIAKRKFDNTSGLKDEAVAYVKVDYLNRVWVMSKEGGLDLIYNNKVLKIEALDLIRKPVAMTTKSEMTFVGTNGHGIYSIKTKGEDFIIKKLEDENTVRGDYIYGMYVKGENVWCAVENGILKINVNSKGELIHSVFYGKDEGFIGIENTFNAISSNNNSAIWFGTIHGIIKLNEEARFSSSSEPKVYLTDIELHYETVNWNKSPYASGVISRFNIPNKLDLPHDENHLTFVITGLDYAAPGQVSYEWKLEPLESDWTLPKKENKIVYTNLPPNDYTLHIRAQGINGKWTKDPYTYSFKVSPPFYRTIPFYIGSTLLAIVLFWGFYRWRVRLLKREQRKLASLVSERTKELENEKRLVETQNEEIQSQKLKLQDANEILEETNEAITDSINYAKRIQHAIMHPYEPDLESLESKLKIFYKPKDIVSGDFYWYNKIGSDNYVCAADCTGHGVPGAFMSMIGITFIKDIINKKGIKQPNKILNVLRNQIVDALNKREGSNTKDGMDLAFYKFNPDTLELTYAGANNPLWVVSKKQPEVLTEHTELNSYHYDNTNGLHLHEIKADKMPIGLSDQMDDEFTQHTLQLAKGDIVWVFSDGYPDQFGGDKGKKFLAKRFKKLLIDLYPEKMDKQIATLEDNFNDWKGDRDQVDDILVMGIEV